MPDGPEKIAAAKKAKEELAYYRDWLDLRIERAHPCQRALFLSIRSKLDSSRHQAFFRAYNRKIAPSMEGLTPSWPVIILIVVTIVLVFGAISQAFS